MGLFDDCVGEKSAKYPVSPPRNQAPMERGMSARRSMGIFASNASLKGKDTNFWRHRLLCFLYKSEGREDVSSLRIPLKQMSYSTIGDFIRDIPAEVYEPYQAQLNPDTGLRKDYKVIWERDGIAEPGALKWEGSIEGRRCMGLQLDRKKAVPFGIHDGKGLFYCKPGHRALVPVDEVYAYKTFLRQFIGLPPRKDSMPLNLLPGRSSVRVAVAKQYKPGDRVHLPTEGKWATILWTGRIDGEWVVDLVYDPEKSATGRVASPDGPCMSRSLSMAEFIDKVGPEDGPTERESRTQSSPTPPRHVPPPPPTTPPPKSPDLEDEVFVVIQDDLQAKTVGKTHQPPPSNSDESELESQLSEDELEENSTAESEQSESDHESPREESPRGESPRGESPRGESPRGESPRGESPRGESPRGESPSRESLSGTDDDDDNAHLRRTFSEPVPDLSKLDTDKKLEQNLLESYEPPPLKSKPTHKPMFNLASFGRKKKSEKPLPVPVPKNEHSTSKAPQKYEFSFFSKNKKSRPPIEPGFIKHMDRSEGKSLEKSPKTSQTDEIQPSFMRKDRSRSPLYRRPDKIRISENDDHRELPVDVPSNLRSLPSSVPETPRSPTTPGSKQPEPVDSVGVTKTNESAISPPVARKYSSDSNEDSSDEDSVQQSTVTNADNLLQVVVDVNQPSEREPSDHDSDTTPPYSPAIKDVGFRINSPTKKESSRSSPFRSLGAMFSKHKTLPPKDYIVPQNAPDPLPPVRKESLEQQVQDTDSASHASEDSSRAVQLPERKLSNEKGQSSFFRRKNKLQTSNLESSAKPVQISGDNSGNILVKDDELLSSNEQMGDQEFLVLDSLEVKDEHTAWSPPPQSASEVTTPKRKGSKGKTFAFGFSSKKQKPTHNEEMKEPSVEDTEMVLIVDDSPRHPESKNKPRSSLRDSFTRTFSFTKGRSSSMGRRDSLELSRPTTLYIDNNEAVGATNIARPKSKSASSVLVDIQPWNDRMGHKPDVYDIYDSPDESPQSPNQSSNPVPALQPKQPDPSIPKHRIFTTPRSLFGFGYKPNAEPEKPKKKTSFKGSKLPKPIKSPPPTPTEPQKVQTSPIPVKPTALPRTPPLTPQPRPPSQPPPPVPVFQEPPSPSARHLKSAMKQRKEIEGIPKGVKVGDRVIWYNGRIPIPGHVKKLYKDGTDKYTAVVKFDRPLTSEPLSLAREGDDYIITVEELLTPEILGIPLTPPVATPQYFPEQEPVQHQLVDPHPEINSTLVDDDDECKSPTVRFVPSPEPPPVPEININLASPVSPPGNDNDRVPPPFQEEEVEVACGVRRGIPSRDRTCCIETIIFAMFYTTNTFDTSVLYGSNSEPDKNTRDIRILLRDGIVYPLRQSGFCEWVAVKELKDLMQKTSSDFNSIHTDAEIMTLVLFERALKLGKFISYSNNMTDYLHQMLLDPMDLSKSATVQQLFENSLEQMDTLKLRASPSPALIFEIPRANDKLVHYEAVIPNLTINISHLLENGPRLCICGMVAKYECLKCTDKSGDKALVYCDNCTPMADQIHFQLGHPSALVQMAQSAFSMDLVAVICVKAGHYTSFVKCGSERASPWLFYDAAEIDNPKVSLEQNLGMWIDRLEKYPGKYTEAFVHPLLSHFLQSSFICIYKPREKSSLV